MTIPSPLHETLQAVGRLMVQAADDWWVIASAAATLHGAGDPPAADVDVLTSERDAVAILATLGVAPEAPAPHPMFRSRVLGRWTVPPLPVEIMAGFQVRTQAGWRPIAPTTRQPIRLGAETIFVPARPELAAQLTMIGRPKDLARARQLSAR